MLAFFNLGLPELIILLVLAMLFVAIPAGVVILVLVLTRPGREPRSESDGSQDRHNG